MKKLITLTLTLSMIGTALAGCGSNTKPSTSSTETTVPESTVSTERAEEKKNIDTALALINSFASSDTSVAENNLTEDYIQHNLAYGTGREAFVGSLEYLASADTKTTVKNIRAFEDGDYVFLQSVYSFAGAGDQVAFDIFRFKDGKIAEHCDVMETITP